MLLSRTSVVPILIITVVHAVLSVVLWLWMAGVTGLGFKDRSSWSSFDHAQAAVVPWVAETITFPGRLLLPVVTHELGLVVLLVANSALWAIVLFALYSLLRGPREQHNR